MRDDELRDALRRVDPPAGFADRVLDKARREQPVRAKADRPVKFALAATLVIATISGGLWYRAEEKRKEGEEARRQVLLSLSIAGSKLRSIEMKVNREQER
jgi:hypothetical protein